MDRNVENLLKIINKAIDNGFNYCEWQYYTTAIPLCDDTHILIWNGNQYDKINLDNKKYCGR